MNTKLTEDDISFDYDDRNGLCIYLEYYEDFEQLKQQILENQKIVDVLIETHKLMIEDGACNDIHEVEYSIVQELESIVKKATGKAIKELS